MKIIFWNVQRGYHSEEICQILKKENADIYLLTEIDRGVKRTGGIDFFKTITQALNIKSYFETEFVEKESIFRYLIRTGGPGGGVHGNAVFTKLPVITYKKVFLPHSRTFRWDGTTIIPELFEPREGQRIAQIATVNLNNTAVQLVNTHLECWRMGWKDRKKQLDTIFNALDLHKPIIFAGDLNNIGDNPLKAILTAKYIEEETQQVRDYFIKKGLQPCFPQNSYTHFGFWFFRRKSKLDWLAVSCHFHVSSHKNVRTPWSDHNYLMIDVEIKKEYKL